MRRWITRAGCVCLSLTLSCASAQIQPVEYRPDEHCDQDHMSIPENLRDDQWIRVRDARKVERALKDCGSYTAEVLRKNTLIAKRNRPDSFWEDLRERVEGFVIGALIALGISL